MPNKVIHKTRVFKFGKFWRVEYYMPYSGIMCADFTTWDEALNDAWSVEEEKQWV